MPHIFKKAVVAFITNPKSTEYLEHQHMEFHGYVEDVLRSF